MSKLINSKWQEVSKDLPDNYFDWVIADPPYFTGPEKHQYYVRKISNINVKRKDYSKIDTWDIPTLEDYQELCRVSKNQIIWGINYFSEFNNLAGSGRLIWDKCNGSSTFSDCEIASISSIDSVRLFSFLWNGMLQGHSVKEGRKMRGNKKNNQKRIHPTEKPYELYLWLFDKFVKKGESVFDPYAGSMSSVVAADRLNIDITAVEADKQMFLKASQRVEIFRQQLKLF